jgi:hypothetical protein
MRLLHGDGDNKLFYCVEDGKVYHQRGNDFNQLEPEWINKKIASLKKLIANHVSYCDDRFVSGFVNDYLDILEVDKNNKNEIKRYAKLGCLMKLNEEK